VPAETTYTRARAELADLCAQVASTREPVIIHRRGHEDVALVPADELRGLQETAHLLRSPRNAARLMKALRRAQQRRLRPGTIAALREELGLGETV
jgi:antitoxin YefM